MSSRNRHGGQIDPFNAGEPDLPWSEPEPIGARDVDVHGDDCALDETPYDGPTKTRDDYSAPDAHAPRAQRHDTGPLAPSRHGAAERRGESETKGAASPDGKGKRKHPIIKAVLIFIIAVNVLPLALAFLGGAFDEAEPAREEPSSAENEIAFEENGELAQEAESACIAAVETRLDLVAAPDGPDRARIADFLDRLLKQGLGCTASDLGIDSQAFAELVASGFTYEVESCYAFSDGTATVYFNSWAPSAGMIANTACQKIFDYLFIENDYDDTAPVDLTEEQKSHIRMLFAEAIDEQGEDTEGFSSIDLRLEGDSWVLDEDGAIEAVDTLLGIW